MSYRADIDSMSHLFQDYAVTVSDQEVINLIDDMFKYGLIQEQIDVLLERFINNKSFAEITSDYGFTNPGITFRVMKKALEDLKMRGFGKHKKGIN